MFKKQRILIADDDIRFVTGLREYLAVSGYEVLTANNGLEALEQAQAQEPDLIILDILMPQMDGLQVLSELRKYSSTPVIILSSQNTDLARIKGLNTGADDFITKPFNYAELEARIKTVTRRSLVPTVESKTNLLKFGDIIIDFNKQSLEANKKVIP